MRKRRENLRKANRLADHVHDAPKGLLARFQDYRDLGEASSFDKIASVGMCEHVGLGNLQAYFDRIAKLLLLGGQLRQSR